MDLLFEFLVELIFGGITEASKSKRVPKPIRYILIALISMLYLSIIGLIIWIGIDCLEKNLLGGIAIILFGLFFLVLCIRKFRKVYLNKIN